MKTLSTLFISILFLILGCSKKEQISKQQHAKVVNPVLDRNYADPTVIEVDDGWIYFYATQSEVNIQVARSRDLVNWNHLGDVMV